MAHKTFAQLISEATVLAEETFDNKQWVEWFNNGIDDLASVLYLDKRATITGPTGGPFPLPNDYITMLRLDGTTKNIKALPLADDTSVGYKIIGGEIELQGDNATTIQMIYLRKPQYVSTGAVNAVIDIPETCTRALVYFACMQGMISEDESERYEIFKLEYNNAKALIQRDNINRRPPLSGTWKVVR